MSAATSQENIYVQRVNLVINYIREHVTDDLSLETLAQVAGFSPFHFHRIFKSLTGQTVNQFTTRLRLERAALLLRASPQMSITEAALACGFGAVASFSRAFKKQYGIAASQWNRRYPLQESKNGQILDGFTLYTEAMLDAVAESQEFSVRLYELPAQRLAYVRVQDSYKPERVIRAYERLIDWYCRQGGDLKRTTLIGMSQDDPDITPLELCHYDFCLTVPESWQPEGEFSIRTFPACWLATIACQGDIFTVDRAWQYLFRYWLPHSRFQPDNLPAMEIYRRQPVEIGWEVYDLECAIPVRLL
jgi:AraC family transcriptional regulator